MRTLGILTILAIVGWFVWNQLDSVDTTTDPDTNIPDRAFSPSRSGKDWDSIANPGNDEWDSETFSANVSKQLKILGSALTTGDLKKLDGLAADAFRCRPLVAADPKVALDTDRVRVERWTESANERPLGTLRLTEAIRNLHESASVYPTQRTKFKIVRVQMDQRATTILLEYFSQGEEGSVELHAKWEAHWSTDPTPKLLRLRTISYERSKSTAAGGTVFSDRTAAAFAGDSAYTSQLLTGHGRWLEQSQNTRYFAILGTPGIALGDVNNDGREDFYLCQEWGLPNRLFVSQPNGTMRDQSGAAGVDFLEDSRSALILDFDNDGDQDLAVAVIGGIVLCANDGTGRFRVKDMLRTSEDLMSLSAADIDQDGLLDIYACAYYAQTQTAEVRGLPNTSDFVLHDANDGGRNMLLRNCGGWKFKDVTAKYGLDSNNSRYSFAASWEDFDNDGDVDLYVANDYGRDTFFRNEDGRFVDASKDARAESAAGGMGLGWGDYDRDGWMDLFVSNMFSSAGNRIAYQPEFKPNQEEARTRLQRFARGNTLLRNNGGKVFESKSKFAGVEMGRWAWGAAFADIDNDGWLDIVVPNGYVTTADTGDL